MIKAKTLFVPISHCFRAIRLFTTETEGSHFLAEATKVRQNVNMQIEKIKQLEATVRITLIQVQRVRNQASKPKQTNP